MFISLYVYMNIFVYDYISNNYLQPLPALRRSFPLPPPFFLRPARPDAPFPPCPARSNRSNRGGSWQVKLKFLGKLPCGHVGPFYFKLAFITLSHYFLHTLDIFLYVYLAISIYSLTLPFFILHFIYLYISIFLYVSIRISLYFPTVFLQFSLRFTYG